MNDIFPLAVSGMAVFSSALILKFHGEPRYRFSAAFLSVSGWFMAVCVALPEKWQADQLQARQTPPAMPVFLADATEDHLVLETSNGNVLEIGNGVRTGNRGSDERGSELRWSSPWVRPSGSRLQASWSPFGSGNQGFAGVQATTAESRSAGGRTDGNDYAEF